MNLASLIQGKRDGILEALSRPGYRTLNAAFGLKAVASELFAAEKSGTASYKTLDEMLAVERLLTADSTHVVSQYFCILAKNNSILTGAKPNEVAARLQDPLAVEKIIKGEYFRVLGDSGISPSASSHLLGIYGQGYISLFGHKMLDDWNPAEELRNLGKSPNAMDNLIKVYFGGKAFNQNRDVVQKEIPKYAGRTGSEDLSAGGRSARLFRIAMSVDEYKDMKRTVLGSCIQAVEVPMHHELDRKTVEGSRMKLEQRGDNSLIYNYGQLQILSLQQVWAIERAIEGKKGAIEVTRKGFYN